MPELLIALPRPAGSISLLYYGEEWFTTSLLSGPEQLPATLVQRVGAGEAARQRTEVNGDLRLAVGVPLEGGNGAYFEVFALEDLDRNFEALAVAMAVAALGAPPFGMLLGRWATRRALRPLRALSATASAVARGDLGARIDPGDDPDLVELATSFNRNTAALQRRVARDARFAADVSHELRSPLTTMLGAVDLVQSGRDRLPPDAAEGVDLLRVEIDRFERLVADLLEISRPDDAGRAGLLLETVRPAELVERSLPPARRAVLRVAAGAEHAGVDADKRRLERVVVNLVENADRHGRGLTAVTVDVRDGHVRILVGDAGPGVPVAERERIFERFARAASTPRTAGGSSGLGLALVRRHVELMGGTVTAGDSPRGGARFTVCLPLRRTP
ncbi:HAMP domain-containing sensor histidine kinase [Pseudonocardia petroleophila]|uniref:histidine kinase n=1 Tax=Pseudonocardia petroleophila TaxID=37331 RepID=A0A7G7MIV9_9PSEU|nr:HAMP domain-containing sensor histidine kinase [Pseudonocardia petroleophila]QNG52720.1 HAMP domain-containing histidine kinase [Pseudonocardia petroleophila]